MSIDVNVQNDLVIVTESSEDITVNVSNAAGPQGPAGVGVPVGGTTGQVLKKSSGTNYDTFWSADNAGVPYIGATGDVNLGGNDLKAGSVFVEGATGAGGALRIKQFGSSAANLDGYNTISTLNTGVFYFTAAATSPNFKNFVLNPSGLTDNTLRTYTLPNLDGTLALLSNIPSVTGFVPYTGATANVDLGTHRILAQNATIASNGSGDTFTLNHTSGSGIGLNITKGGSGEGLYINKTSGSGNAATIIGTLNATTLVKSGGTSSQFLKADGSVDSTTYVGGSGATGQVAYWNGTSSQTGSNNLFWDAANARLGIGTNAPSTTLDIRGKTRIQSSGAAELDIIDGSNSLRLAMGSTQGFVGTLSSHPFGFFTGALKRGEFSTNGNFILQNGGTFTDAGFRLDVNGTARVSDTLSVTSNTSTSYALNIIGRTTLGNASTINFFNNAASTRYGFVYVDSSTFEIGSITGSNIPLIFSTNQSERMRITSGGNVGIGTASPDIISGFTSLTLNGSNGGIVSFQTGGVRSALIYSLSSSLTIAGESGISLIFNAGGSERMRLTAAGRLLLGTTTESTFLLDVNGTARVSGAVNLATSTGNVGIGVTGGVLKLDVQGNAADTTTVGGVTVEQVTLFRPSNGVGGIRSGFNTTTGHAYIWSSTSGGNLNFGTRSAPDNNVGMTLTYGGNLLVGTTIDFGQRFQVSGAGKFSSSVTASILYADDGTTIIRAIPTSGIGYFGTQTNSPLVFQTNSDEKMRITSAGNLLVGTTTDNGEKLQINGTSRFSSTLQITGNGTKINWFNSGFENWFAGTILNSTSFSISSATTSNILTLFTNGAATFSSSVTATQFRLSALNTAPANASATGTLGEIRIDADYIYVCTATNTWKRTAIATW